MLYVKYISIKKGYILLTAESCIIQIIILYAILRIISVSKYKCIEKKSGKIYDRVKTLVTSEEGTRKRGQGELQCLNVLL